MSFDYVKLCPTFGLTPRGVIHVGAHEGQETELYASMGFSTGLFFEPQPVMFERLVQRLQPFPHFRAVGSAVGSRVGTATMYAATNDGLSSSLLKPKLHLEQYPDIPFPTTLEVPLTTLDEFFKTDDISRYNFLNLDVQGYELEVLKGSMAILHRIDGILSEINRAELYEGCVMVEALEAFLSPFGFRRVAIEWSGDTWGEAIYVKGPR